MEEKELNLPKVDLIFGLRIWLRYAKRFWALALVMAVLGSVLLGFSGYQAYKPTYEASVSFTVQVANPLYSTVGYYNTSTAAQLNATFPYILRSPLLQQRVKEHLGSKAIPSITTTVLEKSNIFTIRVRHTDPEWAYEVLKAVIDVYPQVADYVVGATNLTILDDSGIPKEPVFDLDLKKSLVLGAVGGVVLWAGFMLLLTLCRRTIHNEDELQRTLNYQCLGIVPATKVTGKSKRCPLMQEDNGKYGFSESVRLLQMRVQKEMQRQGKQILMVSGAIPSEGKTTISVNLAIAFAKKGHRVLLVDCDMYNPSVAPALNVEEARPVKDYIEGKASMREIVSKTAIAHLYCLHTDVDFKDVSTKESMAQVLAGSKRIFDYIILDTPPCSLLVDAAELSDLAECALMVIRQDYATREQILEGVRLLTDSGLPLIGCTINGVVGNLSSTSGRYGNGYGHNSYSYGYGSRKQDSE